MGMKSNEGKAIDAVIRFLERTDGFTRSNTWSPEQTLREAPIDFCCNIGNAVYAFEHTLIEPFDGHIAFQQKSEWRIHPLREKLCNYLSKNFLYLMLIDKSVTDNWSRMRIAYIHEKLIAWTLSVYSDLEPRDIEKFESETGFVIPDGLDFHVNLQCFRLPIQSESDKNFQVRHLIPEDYENERPKRLERAYHKKSAQLSRFAKIFSSRKVLVFEDNDLQLTNPVRVYNSICAIEESIKTNGNLSFLVDYIFQVIIIPGCNWWVTPLRLGEYGYYENHLKGNPSVEIDPSILVDLTAK